MRRALLEHRRTVKLKKKKINKSAKRNNRISLNSSESNIIFSALIAQYETSLVGQRVGSSVFLRTEVSRMVSRWSGSSEQRSLVADRHYTNHDLAKHKSSRGSIRPRYAPETPIDFLIFYGQRVEKVKLGSTKSIIDDCETSLTGSLSARSHNQKKCINQGSPGNPRNFDGNVSEPGTWRIARGIEWIK